MAMRGCAALAPGAPPTGCCVADARRRLAASSPRDPHTNRALTHTTRPLLPQATARRTPLAATPAALAASATAGAWRAAVNAHPPPGMPVRWRASRVHSRRLTRCPPPTPSCQPCRERYYCALPSSMFDRGDCGQCANVCGKRGCVKVKVSPRPRRRRRRPRRRPAALRRAAAAGPARHAPAASGH